MNSVPSIADNPARKGSAVAIGRVPVVRYVEVLQFRTASMLGAVKRSPLDGVIDRRAASLTGSAASVNRLPAFAVTSDCFIDAIRRKPSA